MDFGHQLVGFRCDDCEGANPLARGEVFPVLPDTADTKRVAILHGDGVGLFGLLALDGLPFEEAVNRNDTPPSSIRLAKCG
jgi:hypothetical protein